MPKQTKNKKQSPFNYVQQYWREFISGLVVGGIGLGFMIWADADFLNALITSVFCFAMGLLLGHDLRTHSYNQSWYPTIGMLGTFIGIVVGLWNLDISADNITNSLSGLLGGLKLAFITSIVGLGLSILRRAADYFNINKIANDDTIEESLRAIDSNTKQFDTEKSIVAQLEALRKDFAKFGAAVTDSAAGQFADALSNVAGDLNNKLAEQFGDNFKKFGESVDRLMVWQQQNKEQMDMYARQFEKYAETYNHNLELLTTAASNVENIIAKTDDEVSKLTKHLAALDELGTTARDIIPEIRELITNSKTQIANIDTMAKTIVKEIKSFSDEAANEMNRLVDTTADKMTGMATDAITKIDDAVKQFETETLPKLTRTVNGMNHQLGEAGGYIAGTMKQLGEYIVDINQQVKEQNERFEKMEHQDKKTQK